MRSRLVAGMLIAVLVIATGAAVAQRARGGQGRMMGRGGRGPCGLGLGLGIGPAIINELGLTTDQVNRLQRMTDEYKSETQPLRTQLRTDLSELATLWTADSPDQSAIRAKLAEVDRTRTQIRNAMVERTFAAMSVLTPAQRTKLRDLVKNRRGFGVGMGYGLGLGCGVDGGDCYLMEGAGGTGSTTGGSN